MGKGALALNMQTEAQAASRKRNTGTAVARAVWPLIQGLGQFFLIFFSSSMHLYCVCTSAQT
jgi:hypothetical protein